MPPPLAASFLLGTITSERLPRISIGSGSYVELRMFTPSIVPASDGTIYIVEDDFGPKLGRVFRETHSAQASREATLNDLYSGQYNDPVRVIAFNTSEGRARDVSHEFATELQRRADLEGEELNGTVAELVEFYTRRERQLSLRLA